MPLSTGTLGVVVPLRFSVRGSLSTFAFAVADVLSREMLHPGNLT